MDIVSRVELSRTKAFYQLLVDKLGTKAWATRKAAYLKRIREKESKFNINLPIEPQLFLPAEDDIDWYILASYLYHDYPYSDAAYSSSRMYPYAMAIGAVADLACSPLINTCYRLGKRTISDVSFSLKAASERYLGRSVPEAEVTDTVLC